MTKPEMTSAPDGGWGWIVCFACFMTTLITDGLYFTFGIIFVELLDYFKEGKGSTAVIASLTTGVCMLASPLIAAATNRFGCRAIAVVGSSIFSGSFVISVFAPNIYFLYVSLGILAGIGYGMVYLSNLVCVSEYFDRRRSLATGLSLSGSGIGIFLFGPLSTFLINAYSWKGAILIQGGIVLNCVACGLVLRPLGHLSTNRCDKLVTRNCMKNLNENNNRDIIMACAGTDAEYNKDIHVPVNVNIETDNEREVTTTLLHTSKSKNNFDTAIEQEANKRNRKIQNDIKVKYCSVSTQVKQYLNFDILRNVSLRLFIISSFIYSLGYYVPYIYLADKAKDSDLLDYEGAWLLSTCGLTTTVGMAAIGFVSDRKCVNRLYLYGTAVVISGVATSLVPWFGSFETLLFFAIVFGICSGISTTLMSVIATDIVGIDKLADALGYLNFASGIAALIGTPIAGWLSDVTGSYDASFVAAGVTILVSGAIVFFVPCIKNKSNTIYMSTFILFHIIIREYYKDIKMVCSYVPRLNTT